MGLKEKKATKAFVSDRWPALEAQIKKAAGFDVNLSVDWDTLSGDEGTKAENFDAQWPKVYFEPLIEGLKQICCDEDCIEAVQEGVKEIKIHNVSGNYSANNWVSFKGGVVTLNHEMSNIDNVEERTKYVVKVIEKEL